MKTFLLPPILYLLLAPPRAHAFAPTPVHVEERAAAAAAASAACPTGNVLINGAFYGDPYNASYAPWNVTHTSGNEGCTYVNGYTPCEGEGNLWGASDPKCFECSYDAQGGSDTISQTVQLTPGCPYTLEATVACDSGHTGTPHVFFRVTLDHDIIIPQQLSCTTCTSSFQGPGCWDYPYPTYRVISGNVTGPASGQATVKVLVSQPAESVAVLPFLITAVRLYS